MILKICNALVIILVCNILQAQEETFIYNNGNKKEFFDINNSVKYIKYCGKQNIDIDGLLDKFPTTEQVMPDVFKITLNNSNKGLFDRKISETDSIFVADELIYKGDGTKQCCFNHILLQTNGSVLLNSCFVTRRLTCIYLITVDYLLSLHWIRTTTAS